MPADNNPLPGVAATTPPVKDAASPAATAPSPGPAHNGTDLPERPNYNTPEVISQDATLLTQYILSCPHVPSNSPAIKTALEAVSLQSQRADLSTVLVKMGDVTEHSVSANVGRRGVDEELERLEDVIGLLGETARGIKGRFDPPDKAKLAALQRPPMRRRRRLIPVTPTPRLKAKAAAAAAAAQAAREKARQVREKEEEEQEGSTRVTSEMVTQWYIAGRYRRVPPEWDLPHGSTRMAWVRWVLRDPAFPDVPPLRELTGVDCSHLRRGSDNYNELKHVMREIESEVRSRGLWRDYKKPEDLKEGETELTSDEVKMWYDQCCAAALHKHLPPTKTCTLKGKTKTPSRKRQTDDLSWKTLGPYIRKSKRAMRKKQLEEDAKRQAEGLQQGEEGEAEEETKETEEGKVETETEEHEEVDDDEEETAEMLEEVKEDAIDIGAAEVEVGVPHGF